MDSFQKNNLTYFTSNAVKQLTEKVKENEDWYYSSVTNYESHPLLSGPDYIRSTNIQIDSLSDQLKFSNDLQKQHLHDATNAKVIFQALSNLTPVQATDERLWVYLCHTECKNYVTSRWLSRTIPMNERKREQEIRHFFVPTKSKQRSLFRDNAVSRLWWMGYLAIQTSPDQPERFLEVLLHSQDAAVQILTRSITQNRRLLRIIFDILVKDWDAEKELFHRTIFREWMSQINFFGGVVLLDSLSDDQLKNKLLEFSVAARDST